MVVDRPSFFSAGRPITEFGEIKIVSSPRTSRTRPVRPVRMVSPGFSGSSLPSETGCAPDVLIQTSPEDLLTDQTPSSAPNALDVAAKATAIVKTREILPVALMERSCCCIGLQA